jgi:hypothetical protein
MATSAAAKSRKPLKDSCLTNLSIMPRKPGAVLPGIFVIAPIIV